jgi:hypothetical protein
MLLTAFSEYLLRQEVNALCPVQTLVGVLHYELYLADAEMSHIPEKKNNNNLQVLTFIWTERHKLSSIPWTHGSEWNNQELKKTETIKNSGGKKVANGKNRKEIQKE